MRGTLLQEILIEPLHSGAYCISALYHERLNLTFHRGLMNIFNQSFDTPVAYSPFLKVNDLEKHVREQLDEEWQDYELDTHPQLRDQTLVQAGYVGSARYMAGEGPLPPVRFCRPKHRRYPRE
jgi:hypothetical protein